MAPTRDPLAAERIRLRRAARIREHRKLRGLTAVEFAERVGVSGGAISHWETGRYAPSLEMQIAIADALDVAWVDLFGVDEVAS